MQTQYEGVQSRAYNKGNHFPTQDELVTDGLMLPNSKHGWPGSPSVRESVYELILGVAMYRGGIVAKHAV